MKNTVHRIKMIKRKKSWVSVGSTMLAAVLVGGMLVPKTVNADEVVVLATHEKAKQGNQEQDDLKHQQELEAEKQRILQELEKRETEEWQKELEKQHQETERQQKELEEQRRKKEIEWKKEELRYHQEDNHIDTQSFWKDIDERLKQEEERLQRELDKNPYYLGYFKRKEYERRQQDYQYQQNDQEIQEGEHPNSENFWKDIDERLKQIEQELRQNLGNVESHETLEYLDYFGRMQTASLDNAESIENVKIPDQNEDFWEVINKRLKQIEQLLQQKFDKGQPLSSEELAYH